MFRGLRLLLTAACLVVVVAGLKAAGPLLVPLVISALLAVLMSPLVTWLDRRRVPTAVSLLVAVAIVLAAILGVAGFFGGSVNAFVAAMPRYQERLDAVLSGASGWLQAQGVPFSWQGLRQVVNPTAVMGAVSGTLSGLAGVVSDTLLVILTMVFMLLEVTGLAAKVRAAIGDPTADLGRFEKVTVEVKNYIVIKTYVSLGTGLLVSLLLLLLGVDFPLLWGVLAFLLNYVPTIGSIIAALGPVLLAFIQHGAGISLVVLGGFVVINMAVGNVIEPQLMGKRLGLSTLVVFLSLVFWGWLWGPAGMLLSVPLTMIVKIALENSESWRWVAVLMDPPPTVRARASRPPRSGGDGGSASAAAARQRSPSGPESR
jgi:predicted PurR-regulated permease PerM